MRVRLRSGLSLIICTIILTSFMTCHSKAVGTSASSAILMDVDSGRILYAQNEQAKMLIASTTKIMTALVAIENGDLSKTVTVTREETLAEGSSMYLKEGEQLNLETLLYGLLLCSGNDAALAVADAVGGSQKTFVSMMNQKATELGMDHSSFANPNGLDDENHYSTALDMAKLACAAVDNETLVRIASTRTVSIGGRTMTNHNKLLANLEGCIGLKTGYTRAAGRTLVSCVVRNGQRLVAVTLQDGNDWADHALLYDYGFSHFPQKNVVTRGETVTTLDGKGTSGIPLIAAETFSWPVSDQENVAISLEIPDAADLPVYAGAVAGQAVISLGGEEIGRVDLLYGKDASLALPEPVDLLRRMQEIMLKS